MKKDILIPEVEGIFMAAVQEKNAEFQTIDWNAYLINDRNEPIDTVLIVSKGYSGNDTTSTMRHSLKTLPPQSYAKIEFLQDEVLALTNEFSVSFFSDGQMYHKKYILEKNSVQEEEMQKLPVMVEKGVLLK